MSNPFDEEDFIIEDDWVEISDINGHKASLRHLATIRVDNRVYHVLGAVKSDNPQEKALMLIREDKTVDGAEQYVITGDEHEIERVIAQVVLHAIEAAIDNESIPEKEENGPCRYRHLPGEFCYCDDPLYLQ